MFKKIILAFVPPALVLALHLICVSLGIYLVADWLDIPMHFLGGAAIASTSVGLIKLAKNKKLITHLNKNIELIFVISLVALIAVFWEFFEYLLAVATNLRWQNTLQDTLLDLLMGLIGSPVGFFISKKIS